MVGVETVIIGRGTSDRSPPPKVVQLGAFCIPAALRSLAYIEPLLNRPQELRVRGPAGPTIAARDEFRADPAHVVEHDPASATRTEGHAARRLRVSKRPI